MQASGQFEELEKLELEFAEDPKRFLACAAIFKTYG